MAIVETAIARHFLTDEIRLFKRFVSRLQLYLCHYQSLVVAIELVNFEDVLSAFYQITRLVYYARLTELEQVFGLIGCNLLLKLIAAQATVNGWAFDGQVTTATTEPHPDGASVTATDITLLYVVGSVGPLLVVAATDQKLPLNFHAAHVKQRAKQSKWRRRWQIQ